MIKGFKDFILRGNVIDLAVAVVIGAAFSALVNTVVEAVINPILALFMQADAGGNIGFTVQVTPQSDTDVKAQLVTGSVNLRSRLNSRSATYFTGFVTWQDEGTQAQVRADITGNTAAPWTIPAVDANGAVRVDGLSAQQLATLSQQVQTILLNALTSTMLRQMMPTESPAP